MNFTQTEKFKTQNFFIKIKWLLYCVLLTKRLKYMEKQIRKIIRYISSISAIRTQNVYEYLYLIFYLKCVTKS